MLMDVNELNTQLDQRLAGIIDEAGKGMVIVITKWDSVEDKDAYTRDALAPTIARTFKFTPWAPLIFTSSVTGQNVTKLFDLALDIDARRKQELKTRHLNDFAPKTDSTPSTSRPQEHASKAPLYRPNRRFTSLVRDLRQ